MAWLGEPLGRYGNSKDHRPDRKQIVVGLVLNNDSYPVCCEMWPGNASAARKANQVCGRVALWLGFAPLTFDDRLAVDLVEFAPGDGSPLAGGVQFQVRLPMMRSPQQLAAGLV